MCVRVCEYAVITVILHQCVLAGVHIQPEHAGWRLIAAVCFIYVLQESNRLYTQE